MKSKDLIPNTYYCYQDNFTKRYFKFKVNSESRVHIYPFDILQDINTKNKYFYYRDSDILCGRKYFSKLSIYEANFSDIVDCLPEDNMDKKIYLRKQKIQSLLIL